MSIIRDEGGHGPTYLEDIVLSNHFPGLKHLHVITTNRVLYPSKVEVHEVAQSAATQVCQHLMEVNGNTICITVWSRLRGAGGPVGYIADDEVREHYLHRENMLLSQVDLLTGRRRHIQYQEMGYSTVA